MMSETVKPADVMREYKTIAVVGASKNPEKEAHTVPLYLKKRGYRIIPINPAAETIMDEKAYRSLRDLPEELVKQVDVVEVFRPSEELPEIARQMVEVKKKYGRPTVFWAQLGLENDEAKKILSDAEIPYVMNQCMRVVHASNL